MDVVKCVKMHSIAGLFLQKLSRPPNLRCVCVLSWHTAVDQPLKIFHILSTSPHNRTQHSSSGLQHRCNMKEGCGNE